MALEGKRRLGRGLDALLGAYPGEHDGQISGDPAPGESGKGDRGRRTVAVDLIDRNPRNPRRDFPRDDLQELADSLKQHGIVQPLVVRQIAGRGERYEIIAGERRWRAAQLVGLHEVPVTVLDVSDREALELAIVENVQRADLNPIEEARGYQALIEEFGYSQADLGATIGKSRVHVTNTLRLLRLPAPVLALLESGGLSAGHGRALLSARDPERLAATIVDKNLSVREAERLAHLPEEEPPQARPRRPAAKDANLRALEKELSDFIGLRVEVRPGLEGRGELRINYRSLEQLDVLCSKLRS